MCAGLRCERGSSLLEFSLVVSMLVLLLLGIVQFGLAYHVQQGLQAGAREGARLASLSQTTTAQVIDQVRGSVSAIDVSTANQQCPPLEVGSYCVSVTPPTPVNERPCAAAQQVTVRVEHRMQISLPLWQRDFVMAGSGVFRCEG